MRPMSPECCTAGVASGSRSHGSGVMPWIAVARLSICCGGDERLVVNLLRPGFAVSVHVHTSTGAERLARELEAELRLDLGLGLDELDADGMSD